MRHIQAKLTVKCLLGRNNTSRLFFGCLLLLLIILTRWAWIDCDGGTTSLTEYGYFVTDEGYYASGGKQKLLYNMFISVPLASPCTYAICPASHFLTWISFLVFGQTTWAHRVFPFLLSTIAWTGLFFFLSRRTLAWIAFILCACCLLNPFLMVYGRTACNDTMMASILLLGYILTRKKGLLPPLLGGVIIGLGIWVKASIWVLFPIGISGAAMSFCQKDRFRRIISFSIGFLVSICIQYGLIRLLIYGDALLQGVTIDHLLTISNSSYSIPNPFDWESTFKGLSSFPRYPTDWLLALWIPLYLVLPSLLLVRRLTDPPVRWDGRLLLYIILPLYTAGISILSTSYAHYYIPVIAFAPVVWFEARHDLKLWKGKEMGFMKVLLALAVFYVIASYKSFTVKPYEIANLGLFAADSYLLPQKIVWHINGTYILTTTGILTLMGLIAHYHKITLLVIAGIFISSLGIADLCYSQAPLAAAFKTSPDFSAVINASASILQVVSIVFFFVVWGLPGLFRLSTRWYIFFIILFACGTAANPAWRAGIVELTKREHLHNQAVTELASLVPENAVVFGERAPQLFLSLKARVAPFPNTDPVPTVLKMHRQYPECPLFAIIDSEHTYHFAHYMKHCDKIQLQVIHTLMLPSFDTGLPSEVFLVRLIVTDNSIKN